MTAPAWVKFAVCSLFVFSVMAIVGGTVWLVISHFPGPAAVTALGVLGVAVCAVLVKMIED
jgi:hypothetical protein